MTLFAASVSAASSALTGADRRALRARAHHLRPLVLIGDAGLTAPVLGEVDNALRAHELIKVRVASDDRELRTKILETICRELAAEAVQTIGKTLVVYRQRKDDPASTAAPPARNPRRRSEPRRTKRSYQGEGK